MALVINKFVSTDIVCVKFFGSYVFAGVGGSLKVFSLKLNTCVKEVEVFQGHKIYGILPYAEKHILVYGSKSICIFLVSNICEELNFICKASISLNDWILSTHWLSGGSEVAIITAHNVAWLWLWKENRHNNDYSLKSSTCHEKCILYSASFYGDKWTASVVFAGTVFSEIVIWMPGKSVGCNQPVLHRLLGHNGVIFSITWDSKNSLLCSTSDDRSVRLWYVAFSKNADWDSASITCSHALYGHSARVWRSIMHENAIISVGEDCHICVWNTQGTLLKTLEKIASGCQWTVDLSADHQLMVAGAGDGSVQLFPFSLPVDVPKSHCISYSEESLLQSATLCIRKIKFLAEGYIVAVTEDGTTVVHSLISESWTKIKKDDRFSNYCILSVSPDRSRIALGSLRGLIVLYEGPFDDQKYILEKQVEDGKIWSLLWLSHQEFLVCGNEGRLSIWQLSQNTDVNLTCIERFKLPRARERWPTAAVFVMKNTEKYLLCGDRCGSLHLFKYKNSLNEYLAPNDSLPRIHGKLGVTSLHASANLILSTGRDGTVKTHRINSESSQLLLLSSDKMIMDWVCCSLPYSSSPKNLFVVGFKETKMIIWSAQERRTILQLECGGGHRSWDCLLSCDGKLEIAYVREKHIYYSSWALENLIKPTLLQGISPRELNCVSVVSKFPSMFLFGGEDGTVLLCKFSGDLSALEGKLTLTSHISSIRCLCIHEDKFFSAGGRAQLKAWQIESGFDGELLCIELASHMLKGERHSTSCPSIDPEMRYMSICSVPDISKNSVVQLVAGCSDGVMRWLTFNTVINTFQLIGESMFHGKCILKVLSFPLHRGTVIIISSATDGRIALWTTTSDMFMDTHATREPFWSMKCHQSGVNSLHAKVVSTAKKNILLIASGGDDNSVAINALNLQNGEAHLVAKWSCNSAHSAQVTGVWLVDEWMVSTSIDQRLTLWHWMLNSGEPYQISCDFIHQSICSIPDIQDMQIRPEKNYLHICVVGKGVQIVSILLGESKKKKEDFL